MSAHGEDIFDTRTPERRRYEQKCERQRRTRAQGKCEKCGNCLPEIRVDPDRVVCGTCIDKEDAQRIEYLTTGHMRENAFDEIEARIVQAESVEDLKEAMISLTAFLRLR